LPAELAWKDITPPGAKCWQIFAAAWNCGEFGSGPVLLLAPASLPP
jgi:hypothetical protein